MKSLTEYITEASHENLVADAIIKKYNLSEVLSRQVKAIINDKSKMKDKFEAISGITGDSVKNIETLIDKKLAGTNH